MTCKLSTKLFTRNAVSACSQLDCKLWHPAASIRYWQSPYAPKPVAAAGLSCSPLLDSHSFPSSPHPQKGSICWAQQTTHRGQHKQPQTALQSLTACGVCGHTLAVLTLCVLGAAAAALARGHVAVLSKVRVGGACSWCRGGGGGCRSLGDCDTLVLGCHAHWGA
jgi:hypothetical protein